jgi:hypothetical protein
MRNAYKIVLGKPERRKPLWGSKRRWEDNNEVYGKEIGCEDVGSIHLTQVRVHDEPPGSTKGGNLLIR